MPSTQRPFVESGKNLTLAKEGSKFVFFQVDMDGTNDVNIDLSSLTEQGNIEFIASVFIDNADNTAPFTLTVDGGSNQRLIMPARGQGYLPIIVNNPPKFIASTTVALIVPMYFMNAPMQPIVWLTQ